MVPGDPKIGDLASTPTGLPATAHIKANASHLIRFEIFTSFLCAGSLVWCMLLPCRMGDVTAVSPAACFLSHSNSIDGHAVTSLPITSASLWEIRTSVLSRTSS